MNYFLDGPANLNICKGDVCVIYISDCTQYKMKVEEKVEQQTKFGVIKAIDLIGHPYGVKYDVKKGWVIPLRLTPEYWTQLLPHRTQILYPHDISMIIAYLDIKPGSVVVESGTGSASLSHCMLRSLLPNGFLYTFDSNQERVEVAKKELKEHGYDSNVKVTCKDICETGFDDDLIEKVDACVLDLPQTWTAIEHAYKILKTDGSSICTFSPCVEQMKQNVAKMTELKFKDITTFECLPQRNEFRNKTLKLWNDDILEALVAVESLRFENLRKQCVTPRKKQKSTTEPESSVESSFLPPATVECEFTDESEMEVLQKALMDPRANFNSKTLPKSNYFYAGPSSQSVTHSGYLTFARKRPFC